MYEVQKDQQTLMDGRSIQGRQLAKHFLEGTRTCQKQALSAVKCTLHILQQPSCGCQCSPAIQGDGFRLFANNKIINVYCKHVQQYMTV